MIRIICCAILLLGSLTATVQAEEWATLGARSRGMGGAGVATGRHPYWNPTFIGNNFLSLEQIEFRAPLNIELTTQGNIIAEIDDVYDLLHEKDFPTSQADINTGLGAMTQIEAAMVLVKELSDLESRGKGLYASLAWGASFRLGENIGVYWDNLSYFAGSPNFDLGPLTALADGGFTELFATTGTGDNPTSPEGIALSNELVTRFGTSGLTAAQADQFAYIAEQAAIDLSDPDTAAAMITAAEATLNGAAAPEETLYYNESGLHFVGLLMREIGVNVSGSFFKGKMSLGIGIKLISGVTFEKDFYVRDFFEEDDINDFINIPSDQQSYLKALYSPEDIVGLSTESTNTFGIDVGILVRPIKMLTLGLSIKNLNHPSFNLPSGGTIDMPTQVRFGVLFQPVDLLKVALDYDVFKNESVVLPGFYSQMFCFGVELSPVDTSFFGLSIRAGAYKNIAEKGDDLTGTLGFGIRLFVVELDVGAGISLGTVSYVGRKTKDTNIADPDAWRDFHEHIPERIAISATLSVVIKLGSDDKE